MSGQVLDFSAADVAAIAAAYDPTVHEAPHVVGHPRTDGPAYGWVAALGVNGAGRLCVTRSSHIDPAFAELVAARRFAKRSACFYPPGHASNPKPEGWYLKHVGWLGAAAPAVKGLADPANFSTAGDDGLVVEFGDWDDELNAGLWRRMREWFIGQFGADTADKVLPAYEVDALQREAMRPEPEAVAASTQLSPTAAYAEGAHAVTTAHAAASAAQIATQIATQNAAERADLDAREARISAQEAAQAALVRQARTAGFAAFCDARVADGRLLPPERGGLVALAESLPDTGEVVEFADGDPAKPIKRTPMEVLQAFINGLPPRVDFAERARPDGAVPLDTADPQAIAKAATAYQFAERQAGREVGIHVAVEHVVRQAAG